MNNLIIGFLIGVIIFGCKGIYSRHKYRLTEMYYYNLQWLKVDHSLQKLFDYIDYLIENCFRKTKDIKDITTLINLEFKYDNDEHSKIFNIAILHKSYEKVRDKLNSMNPYIYFYDESDKLMGTLDYNNHNVKIRKKNINFLIELLSYINITGFEIKDYKVACNDIDDHNRIIKIDFIC